ncbi:AAA family ATPase [Shewanella xiamenensis]|uniref:AAA family ATPase n=1 Tax=Shewanella xiamenensis TaxID=332186 RepID=UPI0016429A81|nr:AAA family ATPase [Shewanella xiamenensis]TVL34505.1 hypothetical protein AYI95_03780 [Shewanella xiamenensis]
MNNLLKSLKLEKITITNLWEGESITLDFNENVTFLTGVNGSGKSSILNVIFDSLVMNSQRRSKVATSKQRFWASNVYLSNKITKKTLVLPNIGSDDSIELESLESIVKDAEDFDMEIINKLKNLFDKASDGNVINYISHETKIKGEWWVSNISLPATISNDEFDNVRPLGFLFQEDRMTLHDLKNCSIDRSSIYWGLYKSSIDERFAYCRDVIQVMESQHNKILANKLIEMADNFNIADFFKSQTVADASKSRNEISEIINLLNEYFLDSGKCVVRDVENKFTLSKIQADEEDMKPISWNLLSRGEKTLLYLFFAVYYYKDKVAVFLLDEPEISFHVRWQKRLIADLCKVAPDNQFIIATHSPSLVMDGWLSNCLELNVK